jgi:MFS family permease
LYNSGAFLQAICGLAFGFLTYITNLNAFLGIAYLLRAIAGMADVAAWGAVLAVLMTLFPTKVSKIMAWTEMFFGLGYMIGTFLSQGFSMG